MWQLDQNIDIHKNNEEPFVYACESNNLKIAKWLWKLDKNIDIHVKNEKVFRCACRNGYLEVAQWLWQLGQYVADATSLRSAHDVRTSGISFYKSIGTGERSELSVSEVALTTQLGQNIDIHALDEKAFRVHVGMVI